MEFIEQLEKDLRKEFFKKYNEPMECPFCKKMIPAFGICHLIEKHTQKEIDLWFETFAMMAHILR